MERNSLEVESTKDKRTVRTEDGFTYYISFHLFGQALRRSFGGRLRFSHRIAATHFIRDWTAAAKINAFTCEMY